MRRLATRFGGIARLPTFKRWRGNSTGQVAPPATWDVTPAPSFSQGLGQTYNVASTGPISLGYTAGGTYDVDVNGQPLPAGITLSPTGTLTDGGASPGTTTGVIFGYNEPNALPVLTLHSGAVTGQLPYMATVYPAEGAVPSGMTIVSSEDSSLRASVLSRWPDNSVRVAVVAGHKTGVTANSTTTITCRAGIQTDTALTTADIASKFTTGISFENFGGGTQTLNSWGSPDQIWWANSQVICARYRQSLNVGAMEAVIDVHAFVGGRAFVEVVIENSKMVTSSPSKPANQTYTGATVKVNGTTIATASSSEWAPSLGGTAGVHQAFVAWYCSGWIGGDPGIEVTHDAASMQAHPMFYEVTAATNQNLQTLYQSDTYSRFGFGRHRSGDMGAPADHDSIGPLPMWEARYLQSGDRYARRAVLASAKSLLTFFINFRDSGTGLVPTHAQLSGKSGALGFPNGGYDGGGSGIWEPAHQPASTLMAFLCQPSPCFIELAQKIAVQNHITQTDGTGRFGYWFEVRGKAWAWRNLAHAVFVTPDSMAFKTPATSMLATNVTFFREWDTTSEDKLNVMWDLATVTSTDVQGVIYADPSGAGLGFQQSTWEHHFLAPELFKAYESKLLSGANQTNLETLVDWALLQPVRWVNELPNGGWRYIGYRTIIGSADNSNNSSMGQFNTYQDARAYINATNPPSVNGSWYTMGGNDRTTYDPVVGSWAVENGDSGFIYVAPFWTALCSAVERGISGADTAWSTVNANVDNLTTFKARGGVDPRHHAYPRNKP